MRLAIERRCGALLDDAAKSCQQDAGHVAHHLELTAAIEIAQCFLDPQVRHHSPEKGS